MAYILTMASTQAIPHPNSANQSWWTFALGSFANMIRNYFWFLLIGLGIYVLFVRPRGEAFRP